MLVVAMINQMVDAPFILKIGRAYLQRASSPLILVSVSAAFRAIAIATRRPAPDPSKESACFVPLNCGMGVNFQEGAC